MTHAAQELDVVARLLVAWLKTRDAVKREPTGELASVIGKIQVREARRLREDLVKAAEGPVESGYLLGPAVATRSPVLFPVLNVMAKVVDSRVELCLRLLVLFRDEDRNRLAGWRFETAESPKNADEVSPHPYPHAQMITSLDGAASVQAADETIEADVVKINETRPAFPLRGESSVGLTASMIASLHGAPDTARIVGDVERAALNPFRAEISTVLCRPLT